MNRRVMGPSLTLTALLVAMCFGGCEKSRSDLEEMSRTKNGDAKLAQIIADSSRPPEMRADASAILMSKGALKELMAAVTQLQGEQRQYLVRMLISLIQSCCVWHPYARFS